jgi:hypothetical protein
LGCIALPGLELDGNLLLVEQVGALKDDAKGALANLLTDAIVDAHDVARARARCHDDRCAGCVQLGDGEEERGPLEMGRPQASPDGRWGLC